MPGHPATHHNEDVVLRAPWSRSSRPLPRHLLRPLQSFLEEEASSGLVLLTAAAAALVWANSPWRTSYEELWTSQFPIRLGPWLVEEDVRHWVNDGLMSLFFLVVGLEIKRELLTGELRDLRTAAVPVVAAIGGMLVPALMYLAVNTGGDGAAGWGVPMATDIAFAVGVLTIAARRAPAGLKPFLLTLAIVDDIGAIVVIAVFFSDEILWAPLVVAVGLCIAILVLQRIYVRAAAVYIAIGVLVWLAVYESGIHPTIAGVALGLLTPAVPFQRPRGVSEEAHRVAEQTVDDPTPPDADAHHWLWLTTLSREAVSPLARVEHLLHSWTSLLVVPLFALANAGVRLSADVAMDALRSPVTLGVVLGLVVGKMAGVTTASLVAVRLGFGRLPAAVRTRHILGVGAVAGIGFTVSIFIAELAFARPETIDRAKIGVLVGSLVAGVVASVILAERRSRGAVPSGSTATRDRLKARDLASPHVTVRTGDPAIEAARILSRHDLHALLVVDSAGDFAGVLTDGELLRGLFPSYVHDAPELARVLKDSAPARLYERFQDRTVADLMTRGSKELRCAQVDDPLLTVAWVMARSHASLVGVVDKGQLIGGISIDQLVDRFLRLRR